MNYAAAAGFLLFLGCSQGANWRDCDTIAGLFSHANIGEIAKLNILKNVFAFMVQMLDNPKQSAYTIVGVFGVQKIPQ